MITLTRKYRPMRRPLLMLIPFIVLQACTSGDDVADAYGNFETDTRYVSAEVSGKLITFQTDEGDVLKSNQLIATIDTTQLHLRKKQLQASVMALHNKLQDVPVQLGALYERKAILKREVERTRSLLQDSAATQKQLDDLTGELNVVEKQLTATKSQLSTANRGILAEIEPLQWQIRQLEDQLEKSQVKVPASGTVLEKFKEPGELIMTGQPLIKMANLEEMTLRAFVSGDQLGLLKLGQEATVSVDLPGGEMKPYPATVSWIASEAEFTPKVIQTKEERVNLVYAVKFRVKNDGFIKIGMPAEVRFR